MAVADVEQPDGSSHKAIFTSNQEQMLFFSHRTVKAWRGT